MSRLPQLAEAAVGEASLRLALERLLTESSEARQAAEALVAWPRRPAEAPPAELKRGAELVGRSFACCT